MSDSDSCGKWLAAAEQARRRELIYAARVLHDDVGQILTAVGLELEMITLDHPEIAEAVAHLRPKLETAFTSVRGLSWDLNPALADRVGLHNALERLATRFQCVYTGQPVGGFSAAQSSALYRIAECAVDHAALHDRPSEIVIRLVPGPPPRLEVAHPTCPMTSEGSYCAALIGQIAAAAGLRAGMHSTPEKGTMWQVLSDIGENRDAV
jgi:hypothetical protein